MSTYTPIATQTLGSAAASVTFSSIPQGYTDLVIVFNGTSASSHTASLQFNSDTGSNYSNTYLLGESGATASGRTSNTTSSAQFYPQTTIGTAVINIANYSNTTTYKTILTRWSNTGNYALANVGLWRSTAAINTVLFTGNGTNFQTGSTFSIYGIQVGDKAQKAQGGNIVTTDGTYVYHTFTSSGSFTPSTALTADYLVVGGGGGGGHAYGGGGGGGGFRTSIGGSALSLSAQNYLVIVGAGGVRGYLGNGGSGGDSIFSTITSAGGGGGGIGGASGIAGGSGGGAGGGVPSTGSAGAGNTPSTSPSQGNSGGGGANESGGGGGGGAGTTGGSAGSGLGGNGGNGASSSISGSSVTYAGGGAGAGYASGSPTGGSGGGGNGTITGGGNAGNGTNNLGGGGGSPHNGANLAGNGGSGVVIIRYAI
jgi:hypothetical protein